MTPVDFFLTHTYEYNKATMPIATLATAPMYNDEVDKDGYEIKFYFYLEEYVGIDNFVEFVVVVLPCEIKHTVP